jgi:hypothetical protein
MRCYFAVAFIPFCCEAALKVENGCEFKVHVFSSSSEVRSLEMTTIYLIDLKCISNFLYAKFQSNPSCFECHKLIYFSIDIIASIS